MILWHVCIFKASVGGVHILNIDLQITRYPNCLVFLGVAFVTKNVTKLDRFRFLFVSTSLKVPILLFFAFFPGMQAKKRKCLSRCFTRNSSKSTTPLGDATADTLPRNRYVWILEFGKSGMDADVRKRKRKEEKSHFRFSCRRFWAAQTRMDIQIDTR